MLKTKEYTQEYDILLHSKSEMKKVYSVLKAFCAHKDNWEYYPPYSVVDMMNDISRIDQHCECHPNECIGFIEHKYIDSPINIIFLELIRFYVSDSTFLCMLANHPSIKKITNKTMQQNIRKQIEEVTDELIYTSTQDISGEDRYKGKPQQNKSIRDYFKYNKANENYITDYLSELKNIFDFTEKLTFGGVCLALFEKKLHKDEIRTYSKFMDVLADYWKVELPKDKHKNKYKTKKDELIYKYAILNRELK